MTTASQADFPYPIYDAHHHFWDLEKVHYPWLATKGIVRFFGDPAPIQKDYFPAHLRADAEHLPLQKSIHIQVGAETGQHLLEAQVIQTLCEQEGLGDAIVAYADLESPQRSDQLDALQTLNRVKGVRQIVGRSPAEDKQTGTGSLIENSQWLNGLKELQQRGLSFDLQLIPEQMQAVYQVLAEVPNLNVALCHCGSPWYREQTNPGGWTLWEDGIKQLASLPNVVCKISGLSMFDHHWTEASLEPIIHHVVNCFGANRILLGSNFPVDKLHTDYPRLWHAYRAILENHPAQFSKQNLSDMFAGNCARFYQL